MLESTFGPDGRAPLSILCLGAHCDDIEIGCGGTLLHLQGVREVAITWAVFSSDPVRAAEVERSATLFLGAASASRLIVKAHRDGFLPQAWAEVKDEFEQLKREIDPDLIFTHARDDLHQDHRLICELTWNTFRNHTILEYEIPKYDGDLGRPNLFQPLAREVCDAKVEKLRAAYSSQAGKRWFTDDLFMALLRLRGMECNSASGLAEAFTARKLRLP